MDFSHFSFKKKLFIIISISLCLTMVLASVHWGPSNDESFQIPYGSQALDYYTSFTKNDSVLDYKLEPLMKNYGAIVDMIPEAIHRVFGSDLMTTRHMVFAFISFFYIFFGALIAQRIAGWNAAFIAMALLVFLPRIFGESFNNPKDPPYAATYIFSVYAFMCFLDSLPKPTRKSYVMLFLGFMSTMLVRVSGLMAVFYFGLFFLLELKMLKDQHIEVDYKDVFKKIIIAGLAGYFISIFFWPSMMHAPLTQPLDALKMLSQYPVTLRNLWEGAYIQSNTIPWYYLPKYFLISNPEITLFGIFLGVFLILSFKKVYNIRRIALLLFASLFPIFFIIYKKTALLTGWRHGYFIYVPLVVFSAIAFAYVLDHWCRTKLQRYAFIAIFALSLLPTAIFMFQNYPLFYVYFNPTFGGNKKALGQYELDYYSHGVGPATNWMIQNIPNLDKVKIVANNPFQFNELMKSKGKSIAASYVRYRERYDSDWDYAIFTQSFIDAEYLKNGMFPPKGTVKSIEVDGAPVCVVLKREDKNDFYGKRALDSNHIPEAIQYLNKAIQYDPNNEIAWTNLGMAYLNSNRADLAVPAFQKALAISPEFIMAKNGLGYGYLQTGNVNYAVNIFSEIIEDNPNYPEPYRILGSIYQQQGKSDLAQQYMSAYQQLSGAQ